LSQAKTIFWNGPMGIFEVDRYARGTREVAKLAADAATKGRHGGGGRRRQRGGGSIHGVGEKFLIFQQAAARPWNFLEGKELPGVTALQ
jgi:3-phosphoglycerate kinase